MGPFERKSKKGALKDSISDEFMFKTVWRHRATPFGYGFKQLLKLDRRDAEECEMRGEARFALVAEQTL
jgi:hypothetical protein